MYSISDSRNQLFGYAPNLLTAQQVQKAMREDFGVMTIRKVTKVPKFALPNWVPVSAEHRGKRYNWGWYGAFESGLVAKALSRAFRNNPYVDAELPDRGKRFVTVVQEKKLKPWERQPWERG